MLKSIKNIFHKKQEITEVKSLTLKSLPDWLSEKEETCTSRRNEIYIKSREDLLRLEQDLKDLLDEFKEEPSGEPRHHKVEQVNRHALPQFIKKIESELKDEFSEDDEVFYQEIAALISGCYAAYRGPGRYLHHLYPDEVKAFRQTLDQMGQELNRMTEVMRISRERLSNINNVRDALSEREDLIEESNKSAEEEKSTETRYNKSIDNLEDLKTQFSELTSSDEYHCYETKQNELIKLEKTYKEKRESVESFIRTALPVWKRVSKTFKEQKKSDEEKKVEDLIRLASSAHRSDDELLYHIKITSGIIFSLFSSGVIHTKNSFEKVLFSHEEEYLGKISGLLKGSESSLTEQDRLRDELGRSDILRKKEQLEHEIKNLETDINSMKAGLLKMKERNSGVSEKIKNNNVTLREKFAELKEEDVELDTPDEN